MFDYRRIQQLANRATGEAWQWYQGHRSQSMKRIKEALAAREDAAVGETFSPFGANGSSVLIAGAGNANDLDLLELSEFTRVLWLVDVDGPALTAAVKRLGLEDRVNLWLGDAGAGIEEIDSLRLRATKERKKLPYLLQELGEKLEHTLTGAQSAARSAAGDHGAAGMRSEPSFDLAVSQCLLSQIHWPLAQSVWDLTGLSWEEGQALLAQSERFTDTDSFSAAVIRPLARSLELLTLAHLQWLEKRLKPEGMLLVNTDISWRGTSLYGTDTERILRAWPALGGIHLERIGATNAWPWQLDEYTEAQVHSTLYAKQ